MTAVLLMVLFHHMLAFFIAGRGGGRRLPPPEIWRHFRNTTVSLLSLLSLSSGLYNPEPKGSPSRHNQALVKKRPT